MKHVAFTFLLVIACTVQAEVLINDTSNNGSFETPDLNGSGWIAGNAPPWLALSGSMFVQHDASVPDGDQFGGAGWDCGGMAQDLLHAIQANTTYTLSVYGLSPTSKWKVAIETTGGSTLSTSAERVGSNWEQETIYYTAPSSGWPVGENLRVELIRVTPQVSTQTWFDKVELTTFAEPPPLPGQASIPNPSNGANDVNLTTDLSWATGSPGNPIAVF